MDFDIWYEKVDPWGIHNFVIDLARIKKFSEIFRNAQFSRGLGIGCGEGHFTSTLDFVKSLTGLDISEVALSRAKDLYPDINFINADLRNLTEIRADYYDFICCLETIYYLSDDLERKRTLSAIKSKGTDNCVYVFSVVVTEETFQRKYFTYTEAINFFRTEFNIIHEFPISIVASKLNLIMRIKRRVEQKLRRNHQSVEKYMGLLSTASPESVYQVAFVLTKKLSSQSASQISNGFKLRRWSN